MKGIQYDIAFFSSIGQGSSLYCDFFCGGFFKFRGQFCGDFLSLFGVILATFGVPGPRGPSRDPFWQHGRKREEQKLDF